MSAKGIGNGLNNMGKITTKVQTIWGIVFTLLLSSSFLALISYYFNNPYIKTNSKVSNPTCDAYDKEICTGRRGAQTCRTERMYNCNYKVKFEVNGKQIIADMSSRSKNKIVDGAFKEIEYHKNDPYNVRQPVPLGSFILILALCILCIIIATIANSMMSESRTYRQLHAGSTGVSMVSRAFNRN